MKKLIEDVSGSKCTIVIGGILDDYTFIETCFIAESLAKLLPNFNFRKICKNQSEWKLWQEEICQKYGWADRESPLIWKEIGITSTKVTYIGGVKQFWELLQDYYNISSHFTNTELEALKLDFLHALEFQPKLNSVHANNECLIITIIGAGRSMCIDLIPQLVTIKDIWLSKRILINLYDEPGCFFKLKKIIRDIDAVGGSLYAARILKKVSDGLPKCDILLYLDALNRDENEGSEGWLLRNYMSLKKIAQEINQYAPNYMKIIFCSMGPTCFYANVMKFLLTKISEDNIVAISAHYGLEVVYTFVSSLGMDPGSCGCPPVWGFLGVNQFIDVCHMVQKHRKYKPNKRATIASKESTLSLGVKRTELRWFFYIGHHENPYEYHVERKAITYYQVGHTEDFQKCKAICDLLKIWYSKEKDIDDIIISLGICSDGTFGITKGLYFSQPVYLKILSDNSRKWTPFPAFPLPHMPSEIFFSLINTANCMLKKILNPQAI